MTGETMTRFKAGVVNVLRLRCLVIGMAVGLSAAGTLTRPAQATLQPRKKNIGGHLKAGRRLQQQDHDRRGHAVMAA